MYRSIIFSCLCLAGCLGENVESDEGSSPSDKYFIGPDELPGVVQKANGGDIASTRRLIQHYTLASSDLERRIYWQKFAADSGDVSSMLNLSVSLMQVGGQNECQEAMGWIKKATASTNDAAMLRSARLNRDSLTDPGSPCGKWNLAP
jgi:hypothetical protein